LDPRHQASLLHPVGGDASHKGEFGGGQTPVTADPSEGEGRAGDGRAGPPIYEGTKAGNRPATNL
jgi:hypothetical protein